MQEMLETRGSIPGVGRSPRGGNGNPLQNFAWRISWTEESSGLQSVGSQSQDTTEWTEHTHTKLIHNIISVSGVHHSTSVSIHISK